MRPEDNQESRGMGAAAWVMTALGVVASAAMLGVVIGLIMRIAGG